MPQERNPPKPGDACETAGCQGRLKVYKTVLNFTRQIRVRYMHCPECGAVPEVNKQIVPLEFAPARTTSSPNNVCAND